MSQSISSAVVSTANLAVVAGRLSSEPRITELPSGDTVVNYEITTETPNGRLSVPVQLMASGRAPAVHADDLVVAVGIIRRRFFRAGGGAASRTEVVASHIGRPGSSRVTKAIEAAAAMLAMASPDAG